MSQKFGIWRTTVCIAAVLLTLSGLSWAATTGKISGTVTDQSNGEPLPGVNVLVVGTTMGAATDINGNYFIVNVPPGFYSVRATMMGFTTVTVTEVKVNIDQTAPVNFNLEQTVIAGQEVTVVADKPPVELDLTASKARITAEELNNSWVTEVGEAVSMQSGVNIHGGVRGGFGLDVTYIVDGLELRDAGSNNALVTVNTSSIQEMELLTGGWNAEYPMANSGIINVVTRSSRERIHGSMTYRMRPPGKYHWGRNIYSQDNWEWWSVNPDGSPGWNSLEYWTNNDGGQEPYNTMTPEQRLTEWRNFITSEPSLTDYADRMDWDIEGTVYGPITRKLGFMVSGRYDQGGPIFPNVFKYNPEYNYMGKLDYDFTDNTRLILTAMTWGGLNGQASMNNYVSNLDIYYTGNAKGWFYSPYNTGKFWPWGGTPVGGGESLARLRAPEKNTNYSYQAKLTHVFSAKTFIEASLQHYRMIYRSDHKFIDKGYYMWKPDLHEFTPSSDFMAHGYFQNNFVENDKWWQYAWANRSSAKVDFTSQIHPTHQVKAGAVFSKFYMKRESGQARWNYRDVTGFSPDVPIDFNPWEAAVYLQDKIELKGMIVNAGVRVDMYNANKRVGYTIADPYALSAMTLGNEYGEKFFSFDPNGRYAVDTSTKVAFSPRIGISHPISENTVLHFMYGHFNQRPGWFMIGGHGSLIQDGLQDVSVEEKVYDDNDLKYLNLVDGLYPNVHYSHQMLRQSNPQLDYERMIQYEVGFEQNIEDLMSLDVTMYYKDGSDMTNLGWTTDRGIDDFDFVSGLNTTIRSDPANPWQESGINNFQIPINGGYYNSRGVEFTLETRFLRHANFRAIYNMVYSMAGKYGLSTYFRDFETQDKLDIDTFFGGSNSDQGSSGRTNERWNPRNTLKVVANFDSPRDLGSFLGDWYLNLFFTYASGRKYTYHSAVQGDYSTEPNNMTWKPYYNTNMRLAKRVQLTRDLKVELSMDVINLFDQKQLRLPGYDYGTFADLENYMENDKLPIVPQTGEDDIWNWYEMKQLPRQIYFGIGFEF